MFSQAGEYGMGAKGFTDTQMLPMKVAYSDLTPLALKSPAQKRTRMQCRMPGAGPPRRRC